MKKNKFDLNALFNNNRFLKVFSLVLGFILWISVVMMVDTNSTYTIEDVPVTIDLTGSVAAANGLDVVDQTQQYVDITVEGTNYEIGTLTADNFIATLSVSGVTEAGVYSDLPIIVQSTNTNYTFSIYRVNPSSLTVEFDAMVEKEFTLETSTPNVQATDGYIIDSISADPTTVVISGPEASVSNVARCVVVNDDKMQLSETTSVTGTLVFYDTNGDIISVDYLRWDEEEYNILIPVYEKVTLPFTFDYINAPDYIDIDDLAYTLSVEEISIGLPASASGVESIHLGTIDFRTIDLNESFTFEVSLLAGYINLDNLQEVTISFDTTDYSKVTLDTSNIIIINAPSGYDVSLLTTQLTDLRVIGETDVVSELTSADLVATVDLANTVLAVGEHRVSVTITTLNDQQAWAIGESSVLISVAEYVEDADADADSIELEE